MKSFFRLVLLALVLLVVALISALTAMRLAIHGHEVTVPNLVGESPAAARMIAEQKGLELNVERQYYSPTVAGRKNPLPASARRKPGTSGLAGTRGRKSGPAAHRHPQCHRPDRARRQHQYPPPRFGCRRHRTNAIAGRPGQPGHGAGPAPERQRRLRPQNQPAGRDIFATPGLRHAQLHRTATGQHASRPYRVPE